MVENIQGLGRTDSAVPAKAPSPLTDQQKATVNNILSQYDPKQLNASGARSILQALKDNAIPTGPSLNQTLSAAGFEPSQIRSLMGAKPQASASSAPQLDKIKSTSGQVDHSSLKNLQSILGQYDLNNMSAEKKQALTSQLNQSGLLWPGKTVNIKA